MFLRKNWLNLVPGGVSVHRVLTRDVRFFPYGMLLASLGLMKNLSWRIDLGVECLLHVFHGWSTIVRVQTVGNYLANGT